MSRVRSRLVAVRRLEEKRRRDLPPASSLTWAAAFPTKQGRASVPALRAYQTAAAAAVLESVRAGRGLSFSVVISRQGGKNELSAQLEAALLLGAGSGERGAGQEGVKAAPTLHPQGKVSLRRLLLRLRELGVRPRVEEGHVVEAAGARLVFLSGERESNVVGHTASLLLEADEAQDLDAEKWDKDFRPMAATTNATTVYYGTPWLETDLLAEVKARHLEEERRDGVRRHFEYDWREVARSLPAYARYVEAERNRLGESHPLFTTQYLLRPLAGGGRLFTPEQIDHLVGIHPRISAPPAGREPEVLGYVAGLDVGGEQLVAGGDPDRSVLTIARVLRPAVGAASEEPRIEVVEHASWQGASQLRVVGEVARLTRDVFRCRRLVVDATGVGEGLAAALSSLRGGPEVVRVRITELVKSSLGYGLLAAAGTGRLRLYHVGIAGDGRQLVGELRAARAEYRKNGRLGWSVPASEGHDDYAISLALCVEAAAGMTSRSAVGRGAPEE